MPGPFIKKPFGTGGRFESGPVVTDCPEAPRTRQPNGISIRLSPPKERLKSGKKKGFQSRTLESDYQIGGRMGGEKCR